MGNNGWDDSGGGGDFQAKTRKPRLAPKNADQDFSHSDH